MGISGEAMETNVILTSFLVTTCFCFSLQGETDGKIGDDLYLQNNVVHLEDIVSAQSKIIEELNYKLNMVTEFQYRQEERMKETEGKHEGYEKQLAVFKAKE